MRRIATAARSNWRERATEAGFQFHTIDGAAYWDETAYYAFSLAQIENDLEDPTAELHAMAMDLVDEVVASEELLTRLAIPADFRTLVARSWRERQPHLYGRVDLAYDGKGPAKLYELNYDTPTSLYEAAFFQWQWLEDMQRSGRLSMQTDQFNSIHEALIQAFSALAPLLPAPMYFAAVRDSIEDQGTVDYLHDCATQAGIDAGRIAIEDIGISGEGDYTDLDDQVIRTLFKLYPLEDLFAEPFGQYLRGNRLRLLEPAWKAVLSNKGILPLLWERHPNHPNLLPAFFAAADETAVPGWVVKPLHSREGANIDLQLTDGQRLTSDGPYIGPRIRQAAHPLPCFDDNYPLIGSWVIGDRACGIGIREDASLITRDSARFVPHVIEEQARTTIAV